MKTIKEMLQEQFKIGDIVQVGKEKWKIVNLNAHPKNTGIPTTFVGRIYRSSMKDFAPTNRPVPYKFAKKTTI